jgi:hypothetical protein
LFKIPPRAHLDVEELDKIYALEFTRDVHPFYKEQGKVKAMETNELPRSKLRGIKTE